MMSMIPAFLTKAGTYLLLTLALLAAGAFGQEPPLSGLTAIGLGGQLSDTVLEYVVNLADPRAGGLDTVTMVYTVPEESWVSIGFSSNGEMIGSDAVVGLPSSGAVLKYGLSSYVQTTGVLPLPEAQQTLIETSIVQDGGTGTTRLQFTKIMDEAGEVPIVLGSNIFIGAIGMDNAFFYHGKRDSFGIELLVATEDADADADATESDAAPATAVIIETRNRTLWKAHGWCAALAWGLFSPLAIGAALLRKWFPDGLWLKIHQYLNWGVGLFTIAAFGLAVAAINSETPAGSSGNHFSSSPFPHRFIGLVVFAIVAFQVASGQSRPHTPAKGEEKSVTRKSWEILHRVLGVALLALGWYQIQSGIQIYQRIFADSASRNLSALFWGIVGSISGVIVVGAVVTKITDSDNDEDEDSDKEEVSGLGGAGGGE